MRPALLLIAALASGHLGAATLAVQVTDGSGKPLADAVVYAMPPAGKPPPKAASAALINQINREFVPFVSVMQAGTVVSFPNKDDVRHHVYSFSPAKSFELRLYSGAQAPSVTFDKPGLVTLGCNIHDHMIAHALVVDTPWFAKTGASGKATIEALPADNYDIHAWHPRQAQTALHKQRYSVKSAATSELAIRIEIKQGN